MGLAAGFDKNAEAFPALSRFGFGFVELGTVTPKPQEGNPRPRIWRKKPQALVNHLGFNNVGLLEFRRNILRLRPLVAGMPLLLNIGKGRETPIESAAEDYRLLIEGLKDCADGFVVNVSSPNTPGLFQLQTAEFVETVAALLPPGLPSWIKLSPDLEDQELVELCSIVRDNARIQGVVLTNSSRRLAELRYQSPAGGMSGEPLFERSLECVALARKNLSPGKVIIGVGGITSSQRARQMRDAGADLVEIYTGFIYQGPRLVRELNSALS